MFCLGLEVRIQLPGWVSFGRRADCDAVSLYFFIK